MDYKKIQQCIINTLCYSDIFDYPLTSSQIWKYYIGEYVSKQDFEISLGTLSFLKQGNYYSLPHRTDLNTLRVRRQRESKKKIEKANRIIHLLSYIPTIQLIGISGSVALLNADHTDDIDLFFITKKDTLWLTRLIVTIILILLGIKRTVKTTITENTICPNMFMAENNVSFSSSFQNLFIAHEIGQLRVIINKNRTYEQFLHQNNWVTSFLPHTVSSFSQNNIHSNHKSSIGLKIVNKVAYVLQHLYMYRRKTREIVREDRAAFHPLDRKSVILSRYNKKIKENRAIIEYISTYSKLLHPPLSLASN